MQKGEVQIFTTATGNEIEVKLKKDTVWLDAHVIAKLFEVKRPAIVKHIANVYKSGELEKESTCSILEQVAADGRKRKMNLYNLDVIISVGYKVNSVKATKFRQWATQRLKDYLVKRYAINQKRLEQKQDEIQVLKNGISILVKAIEERTNETDNQWLQHFAKGLELLDDYDHETLDKKGLTLKQTQYPTYEDYRQLIEQMASEFDSSVFGKEKDHNFSSSIAQIAKGFGETDFYPNI